MLVLTFSLKTLTCMYIYDIFLELVIYDVWVVIILWNIGTSTTIADQFFFLLLQDEDEKIGYDGIASDPKVESLLWLIIYYL